MQPFLTALSGSTPLTIPRLIQFLTMNLTLEQYAQIVALLALAGLALTVARHQWTLPALLLGGMLISPWQEQDTMIPVSLLAAVGAYAALAGLSQVLTNVRPRYRRLFAATAAVWLCLILILNNWTIMIQLSSPDYFLGISDRTALIWVRDNMPMEASFVVITNVDAPHDPLAEWFYPISMHPSLATFQGREWLRNQMPHWMVLALELQNCYSKDAQCLADWFQTSGLQAGFIYLRKPPSAGGESCCSILVHSLKREGHDLIYDGVGAAIFKWK
jgi:hypothetical protein